MKKSLVMVLVLSVLLVLFGCSGKEPEPVKPVDGGNKQEIKTVNKNDREFDFAAGEFKYGLINVYELKDGQWQKEKAFFSGLQEENSLNVVNGRSAESAEYASDAGILNLYVKLSFNGSTYEIESPFDVEDRVIRVGNLFTDGELVPSDNECLLGYVYAYPSQEKGLGRFDSSYFSNPEKLAGYENYHFLALTASFDK